MPEKRTSTEKPLSAKPGGGNGRAYTLSGEEKHFSASWKSLERILHDREEEYDNDLQCTGLFY
jgi:hypothetical protein